MAYKYAYQKEGQVARAVAKDVGISTKTAVMVANFIKGKSVKRAIRDLENVLKKTEAVPFTRFTEGAGHKPGMGPGKYPQKAAKAYLTLLKSAAANAQDLGLGEELAVVSVTANKGARSPNHGRHRGRMGKATHVEVIVQTVDAPAKSKTTSKPESQNAKQTSSPSKSTKTPKKESSTKPKVPKEQQENQAKEEQAKVQQDAATPANNDQNPADSKPDGNDGKAHPDSKEQKGGAQ